MFLTRTTDESVGAQAKPHYEFEAPRELLAVLPALLGLVPLLVSRGQLWYAIPLIGLIALCLVWSSVTFIVGSTAWYRTGLDRRLIELSRAGRGCRVLNAICGTGSLAVSFAKVLRPAEVWAVDRWKPTKRLPDPSKRTRDNIRIEGVDDVVQVRNADPLNLPFKSGHFTVAGTRYGISNTRKDRQKTVLEMLRALRTGGTIVLAETLPTALWLRYMVLAKLARDYRVGAVSLSRFHFTFIVSAQKLG